MKNAIRWMVGLALAALVLASENSFAAFSISQPLKFSIALPSESLITDDLDVRDELNRPLQVTNSRHQFERLWIQSLNQKILFSLTPTRIRLIKILNSIWDRFTSSLQNTNNSISRYVGNWIHTKRHLLRIFWVTHQLKILNSTNAPIVQSSGSPFLFLLQSLLSSTQILR